SDIIVSLHVSGYRSAYHHADRDFDGGIGAVVGTAADAVASGRKGHDAGGLNRIAQADQTIGEPVLAVELLDFVEQVAQFTVSAVEALFRTDEADVVPHDVANRRHIPFKQGRVRLTVASMNPRRDTVDAGRLAPVLYDVT